MPETLTVLSNHASSQDVSFLWSEVVVAVAESCEASRDNFSVSNSYMKCISGAIVAAWSIVLEMIKHFGVLNLFLTGCLALTVTAIFNYRPSRRYCKAGLQSDVRYRTILWWPRITLIYCTFSNSSLYAPWGQFTLYRIKVSRGMSRGDLLNNKMKG